MTTSESCHLVHRLLGNDLSNSADDTFGLFEIGNNENVVDFISIDDDLKQENASLNNEKLLLRSSSKFDSSDAAMEREIASGDWEEPFFVADLGVVVRQLDKWQALMPRVAPFYAIKCNPDRGVLTALEHLGAGFDCASKAEIATILELGVDPTRIIYANPCKPAPHIRYARERGVTTMTFDNLSELVKIRGEFPEAELVLRIATDDSKSVCQFSTKFGAALSSVEFLLQAAKAMELNIVGVSFHVGSGCCAASQYHDAIKNARFVFEKAYEIGYSLKLLDIGGGFPGVDHAVVSFEEMARVINESLEIYFNTEEFPDVRVIAEPGRYFACAAFTLAVSITSRRTPFENFAANAGAMKYMYYINDGIYGSFNCIFFDHVTAVQPQVLTQNGQLASRKEPTSFGPLYPSSLWGPTCDSIDCIFKDSLLPELEVGDWLAFENMGAYTRAAASTFNGFPTTKIVYINQDAWRSRAYFARYDIGAQ